jgi:hypothetical protein
MWRGSAKMDVQTSKPIVHSLSYAGIIRIRCKGLFSDRP